MESRASRATSHGPLGGLLVARYAAKVEPAMSSERVGETEHVDDADVRAQGIADRSE